MITVSDLDSPFDNVDSPTTVATPSCCCCCCCLASISTASVLTGRLVRRDAVDGPNADRTKPTGRLVLAAVVIPTTALVAAGFAGSWMSGVSEGDDLTAWAAAVVVGLGAMAALAGLRISAGADTSRAWGVSALMAVLFPVLILAEVFFVLFTAGFFWLTIPLWIVIAVKQTKIRTADRATSQSPPVPPPSAYELPPPPRPGNPAGS